MPGESKSGMQCAEFEVLISEALDAQLTGQKLENFQAHAQTCALCGPQFVEADAGRRWLKSLVDAEAPAGLVDKILVATSGLDTSRRHGLARAQVSGSWFEQLRGWAAALVNPVVTVARQPRFAMSFGMAFFSLSIGLSLTGVRPSDLRHADLRPSAIKRAYYETSGRVVKYYENIRFVYQIESRMREFKRANTPAESSPDEQNAPPSQKNERKNNNNDDTSGQPERERQERNYSQGDSQPVLAALPDIPPVVMIPTYRRFV
jgi:hypothetical protein